MLSVARKAASKLLSTQTRRAALPDPDKAWQVEKYQGILLNTVFAFYTNVRHQFPL